MTELTVWGGAGEHGRSCYIIADDRVRIMLDCGVKKSGTGEYPLLDEAIVSRLDAVFLSHAHEDHSMAIPLLYKMGYTGSVWTTRQTEAQLSGYFDSWETHVKRRSATLPYEREHIGQIRFAYLEEAAASNCWFEAVEGVQARWGKSGHLLGSVWLQLNINGKRVFYSGDYTSESSLLVADTPEWLQDHSTSVSAEKEIDLSIVDAAYGSDGEQQSEKISQLHAVMQQTLERGGTVLLPVPAVGRSQELMLWARESFPSHRIIAERAIAAGFEQLLACPTEWLHPGAVERVHALLSGHRIRIAGHPEERERILSAGLNGIVFTDDGMMNSAKAQWYYDQLAAYENNLVLLTGHLAKGSFGQQLLEQASKVGSCETRFICYKVHQGLADVRTMLRTVPSRKNVLVHAGKRETDELLRQLEMESFRGLFSLEPGGTLSF